MRQIVLDTETTGLEPEQGHRIIEIGCVELVNRRLTGNDFHQFVNPQREIEAGAEAVHGISSESLADKPLFVEIAPAFMDYVRGAELIIHNADFDVGFLDAELARMEAGHATVAELCTVIDTLALARRMHPGQRNSLDALCKRYQVDNSRREHHGALLDAQLLAEVYLAMTGGQTSILLDEAESGPTAASGRLQQLLAQARPVVIRASAADRKAHAQRLKAITQKSQGVCLWPAED